MIMGLELINWLKDGKYRIKVLGILSKRSLLSSELAQELGINRASMSRILKTMKMNGVITSTTSNSRTVTYSITRKGKDLLSRLK